MTPRKSKAKSGVKINWDARPPFKTKPPAIIIPQPKLKDNLPPDISWDNDPVSENKLHYGEEGLTCTRYGLLTNAPIIAGSGDGNGGAGTAFNAAFNSGQIPRRGTPHPYITNEIINAALGITLAPNVYFAADEIELEPVSSTQFKVTVRYGLLNGATQEPSIENNSKAALLTIISSVQNQQVSVDYSNSALLSRYAGAYDIMDAAGYCLYAAPGSPNIGKAGVQAFAASYAQAQKQIPNTVFRFVRRETEPDYWGSLGIDMGVINSAEWTIAGTTYDIGTILCIRVEADPHSDKGMSYILTREFQFAEPTPARNATGTPGQPDYIPAQPKINGWEIGTFFTIQGGYAQKIISPFQQVAQSGQTPPDASASQVYWIYASADFNELSL
jgi:hypothetical protein